MHGLLRCNINTGVHAHSGGADMSLRDVTIARDGKQGYTVQMTSRTGSAQGILGDFEKVIELRRDLPRGKMVGFRLLAETFVAGATRVGGGADEKASIERLCLSPYVEEPLNSKLIKNVLYLNWVFRISRFLCSMYMCNELPMYISHIHVNGHGTKRVMVKLILHKANI